MKIETYDNDSISKIDKNLKQIVQSKPYSSKTKVITRSEFLDLNYQYLVMNDLIHN
jgi:hypothetical protein